MGEGQAALSDVLIGVERPKIKGARRFGGSMRHLEVVGVVALALLVGCGGTTTGPEGDAAVDGASVDTGAAFDSSVDGSSDAPSETSACGGATCAAGEVCVTTHSSGGPCYAPNDAGVCPSGTRMSGGCCINDGSVLACKSVPAECLGGSSCGDKTCASKLCGGCICNTASAAGVDCSCLAP